MYYFANIISVLLDSPDEEHKIANDVPQIVLGLSGKGAKLTDWISSECPCIYEEAQNHIEERTGVKLEIRVQFSPDTAKTEIACGMLCNLMANGEQANEIKLTAAETYMGAEIIITNKEGKSKSIRSDELINLHKDEDQMFSAPKNLSVEIDKELADFDRFVKFFNKVAAGTDGDMRLIPEEWYQGYKKTLLMHIKESVLNTLAEDRFEPPFIIMLKVFLEDYAEEYLWKN
jgi:hypothetical protein